MDLIECIHSKIESIRNAKEQRYLTQLSEVKQRVSRLTVERSRLFSELEDALHKDKNTSIEMSGSHAVFSQNLDPSAVELQSNTEKANLTEGATTATGKGSADRRNSKIVRDVEATYEYPEDKEEEREFHALSRPLNGEDPTKYETMSPSNVSTTSIEDKGAVLSTTRAVERITSLRKQAALVDKSLQEDRTLMTTLRTEHSSILARLDALEKETCHAAEVWESEESARLSVATTVNPLKRKRDGEKSQDMSRRKIMETTLGALAQILGTIVGTVAWKLKGEDLLRRFMH